MDFSWTEGQLKLRKAVIEFESERDLCDTIGGRLYSGTSDNQRMIIARYLGS
jgi:hypothetical protein